jgi:hypothetical protein
MNWEQEKKIKEQAMADAELSGVATPYGMLNTNSLDEPCRASLRERVESHLYRAKRESRNQTKLEELCKLLEKHPDVARILDLVEEFRA